jgi:2-polyprenyl-6-methoxyphenol hydroxylase-like FAD-dependent oxidoreductase
MYGPRGDTGFLAYATFVGDHATASSVLMVSSEDKELRALREPAAFDAVAALLPALGDWVRPETAEPTTEVLPMGALRNVRRRWSGAAGPGVPGLQSVGDALCHTNPTFALGASQALEHAVVLRDALESTDDLAAVAAQFADAVDAVARSRHAAVNAEDEDRRRLWRGDIASPLDRDAAPAMYLRAAVYPVAVRDPELGLAVLRRIHALDPIDRLASDADLMARAAALIGDGAAMPRPAYPSRSEVSAAVASAVSA